MMNSLAELCENILDLSVKIKSLFINSSNEKIFTKNKDYENEINELFCLFVDEVNYFIIDSL